MSLDPYLKCILSHSSREQLVTECPALALFFYQHLVATLTTGGTMQDPFANSSRQDAVTQLLSARCLSDVFRRVFDSAATSMPGTAAPGARRDPPPGSFWETLRAALESAWAPHPSLAGPLSDCLTAVAGRPHFRFASRVPDLAPEGVGVPLSAVSLRNALTTSRRFLRSALTCALAGSLAPLREARPSHALGGVLQRLRLVPPTPGEGGRVTAEGLAFCLLPPPQQWWALVRGAVDRAAALAAVPLPMLWQLLGVLAALDSARYMHAFPDKTQDVAGHHLLARLAEVGLVYPVQTAAGTRCFVLSPHFHHALEWRATAPLCATSMLGDEVGGRKGGGGEEESQKKQGGTLRREDTDTIITETNFRLYAYTCNPDLIRLLDQFATQEEVVEGLLHCYRITRESFAAALRKGLTAAQILQFLSLHAHPSMLQKYSTDERDVGATSTHTMGSEGPVIQRGGVREVNATDLAAANAGLVIPQSLCDQLLMWESECNRVVFKRHLVLLKCMTAEQQHLLQNFLTEMGKPDAIVHVEPGYMALDEEAYNQFIAGAIAEV